MDVRWQTLLTALMSLLSSFFDIIATYKQERVCYFPERWEGEWFQSGVRQSIIIDGPRLSSKGRCLDSDGDKFLLVDDKRACYRCVVIHEKHANVLQYKETFCHQRTSLSSLCSLITGDALLYSMFRVGAIPVPCPFRGPFVFTYNRGHGECRSPVSSVDACTEESRLLLSYQACPDVHGSESTVEELQCLAVWKEGSARYLVGKVHHSHATSNEDRFRCFVYEKASTKPEMKEGIEFRVAQSGDATCNGLFSATEGSRTITLKTAPTPSDCRFPSWLTGLNHWHSLDYSITYSFHHRNSTLKITNSSGFEMRVVCTQIKQTARENQAKLLTHFTRGCESGYMCMFFQRRDIFVVEVQVGTQTKRLEDACATPNFNKSNIPFATLVTSAPESRPCPYTGKFSIDSIIETTSQQVRTFKRIAGTIHQEQQEQSRRLRSGKIHGSGDLDHFHVKRTKRLDQLSDCDSSEFTHLSVGCSSPDTMEFHPQCFSTDVTSSYSCHGRWEENGTSYLIASPTSRSSHGALRHCFIFKEYGPDTVLFSTSSANCNRNLRPGITGELVFNVSKTGKCIEVNNSDRLQSSFTSLLSLLFVIYIATEHVRRIIER